MKGRNKHERRLKIFSEAGKAKTPAPSLLIVPAFLIANWLDEIEHFAPSLHIITARTAFNRNAVRDIPKEAKPFFKKK